jgi:hypothetical protein
MLDIQQPLCAMQAVALTAFYSMSDPAGTAGSSWLEYYGDASGARIPAAVMHNRQQAVGQPALDIPRQIEHRAVARADRAIGPSS